MTEVNWLAIWFADLVCRIKKKGAHPSLAAFPLVAILGRQTAGLHSLPTQASCPAAAVQLMLQLCVTGTN